MEDEVAQLKAQLGEVYTDRNLLAQVVAVLARRAGMEAGWAIDHEESEWPVLLITMPTGQVSYHIPQAECIVGLSPASHPWDGHSTEVKRKRLQALIYDRDWWRTGE